MELFILVLGLLLSVIIIVFILLRLLYHNPIMEHYFFQVILIISLIYVDSYQCNYKITNSNHVKLSNKAYHHSKLFSKLNDLNDDDDNDGMLLEDEPMFSVSYDPFKTPNQVMLERDLEDLLMKRATRFLDNNLIKTNEICYLVGLEDKSLLREAVNDLSSFTMEESLTELSELAGAAGLRVIGSTYQRVNKPSVEYYIGQGKTKDIQKNLMKLQCSCVIFDAELTPSQQKNLEVVLNEKTTKNNKNNQKNIKVIDRTALILDIFAQHAKTKEGQLQVQLALLTYRLPRLTNMWSHLERQSAAAKGRSNGGVGLRGPGEKQLESDKRQMQTKISALNKAIDSVRTHRSKHRYKRRQLGVPVIALVGYTNSGKSTLLNSFTKKVSNKDSTDTHISDDSGVFVADMLFATLDPTTRMIRAPGLKNPDILITDTVGFIQKLPTNLIAAFRATLEEISEADVLFHVTDLTNDAWRKQEAAVLTELSNMGLANKPIVTIWNKIDCVPETKEFFRYEASKRSQTVAISAKTGEGSDKLLEALEVALSSQMQQLTCILPYEYNGPLLNKIHRLSILEEVKYNNDGILIKGRVPKFLCDQIISLSKGDDTYSSTYLDDEDNDDTDDDVDMDFDNDYENDMLEDNNNEMEEELEMSSYNILSNKEEEGYIEKKRPIIIEVIEQQQQVNTPYNGIDMKLKQNTGRVTTTTTDLDDENDGEEGEAMIEMPKSIADIDWKGLAKGRHAAVKKHHLDRQ